MSILSNTHLRPLLENGTIQIDNMQSDSLQPASFDLHLSNTFRCYCKNAHILRYEDDASTVMEEFTTTDCIIMAPDDFILSATTEILHVPRNYAAIVAGRSSWARRGLIVHAAGFVDPGFNGSITLEMKNIAPIALSIPIGVRIAQVSFYSLSAPANPCYGELPGSKYQNQGEAVASRSHLDLYRGVFEGQCDWPDCVAVAHYGVAWQHGGFSYLCATHQTENVDTILWQREVDTIIS